MEMRGVLLWVGGMRTLGAAAREGPVHLRERFRPKKQRATRPAAAFAVANSPPSAPAAAASAAPPTPTDATAPPARRPGRHRERHAYWRGNEPARQGSLVGWQGLLEAEMTEKFVPPTPRAN